MRAHTVVVGAGAAGCVIASRLSDRGVDVVLLEAGPDYPDALPNDLQDGTRNSYRAHDWGLKHRPTVEQFRFPLPRGKVVGGSSAVNTCIALRGVPRDYDEWGELGLQDWSWPQCLPAFKRVERDLDYGDTEYHGSSGPLPIRRHRPDEYTPWQAAFLEACTGLGYPECADHNRPGAVGAGPTPLNHVAGKRVSAAQAWLTPDVRARATFRLVPNATVVRVLLDQSRSVGVEALIGGKRVTIDAERVVLCGGAIHTPGVLLRSGIGPSETLARLEVPVVQDLPVGERLLDHPGLAFFLRPLRPDVSQRRAPLMQNTLRLGSTHDSHEAALMIQPGSFFATPYMNFPWVSLMVFLGKPLGSGKLHWPSAKPHARPRIESQLLSEPRNLDQAVEALTLALQIAQHPSASALARPMIPWSGVLEDPKRLRRWAPYLCDSSYHPCGTVPMGPASANWAVCDGRGQVRGIDGLVVGDASLFPTIPSSNIHLPTLMVAERIAQFLT